jgi:AraC-like DNA-binding protein
MHMHSSAFRQRRRRAPEVPSLVFRTVLQGVASVAWRSREVRVDEDSWLVLDAGRPARSASTPSCARGMLAVVVPADDVKAAMTSVGGVADAGPATAAAPAFLAASVAWPAVLAFADNLRPRDGPAGRRLLAIAESRAAARPDPEERQQRIALVRDAWAEELALRRRADRIDCVKAATREQLLRRLLLAADFIASRHDEPISLDEMARAASLSRFHFVRLFSLVHGETPHAYLRRKRTAVARRHLAVGSACSEAASRAGFGSRSSLFRNLRKTASGGADTEPCFPSA